MKTAVITGGTRGIGAALNPAVTQPKNLGPCRLIIMIAPSGHTSTAFATATALTLQYPKWYVIAPSYVYAGLVGYSRMHPGVHHPSDVLAGALIGAGCAYLSHVVNKKLMGGHARQK